MNRLPRFAFACLIWTGTCIGLSVPALAGLKEGVEAYEAGNVALAFKEFLAAAEKGEADCQYNVALMYERGLGVEKDLKASLSWYRKSAELGNSNAQFNLGVMHENGQGTAVDFMQANQWYRKAAVQGDALATINLGMLYIRGDGVKVDKVVGIALLLQAATMDNSPENNAKQKITGTPGLTPEIVGAAQVLAGEMGKATNLLIPLDAYLLKGAIEKAAGNSK